MMLCVGRGGDTMCGEGREDAMCGEGREVMLCVGKGFWARC